MSEYFWAKFWLFMTGFWLFAAGWDASEGDGSGVLLDLLLIAIALKFVYEANEEGLY